MNDRRSHPRQHYDLLYCEECCASTSHVEVDTVEGKKMQCELCGTFKGEAKQ